MYYKFSYNAHKLIVLLINIIKTLKYKTFKAKISFVNDKIELSKNVDIVK